MTCARHATCRDGGVPLLLSLVRAILSAALCIAFAAAQDRIEFIDELMPGCDEPGWLVFLVVDDLTGEPVAGAEVFLVLESNTPIAGEFWFTRKVTTDADGVLRAPVADIEGQWHIQVLRHPDYGTCTRSGGDDDVWRVGRPFDVPVLVLDWQGQPAAGAAIGFCGGCGHCPDLANAVTGADGVAVLRGIDPHNHINDIYVQKAGLGLGYQSLAFYPGAPPTIIECAWSIPLTGRVVDHRGEPVAGAFVSAPDVHRGPWGRTAEDGSFTVLGARPSVGASHVRTAGGRKVWFPTPGTYPVTLKLPDLSDPNAHHGSIDTGEWQEPAIPTRKVRVRFETSGEQVSAFVRLPGRKSLEGEGDTIEVPVEGPFAIEISDDDDHGYGKPDERCFAFADASELPPEPVLLRWFAPTRVRGSVVDGQGTPVAARLRLVPHWELEDNGDYVEHGGGPFELRTIESGLFLLEVVPEREDLWRRAAWVTLPLRGDDNVVEIGEVVLPSEPALVVEDADGPLADEKIFWSRAGFQEGGQPHGFALDHEGRWQGPDLRVGDTLLVKGDRGAMPWRTVLRGDGPWRLTAPQGQVDVRVTTSDGRLVVPRLLFGAELVAVKDTLRLRRLRTGETRLYASAPGYCTAMIDTVVGTEPRTIEVTLPAR